MTAFTQFLGAIVIVVGGRCNATASIDRADYQDFSPSCVRATAFSTAL